MERRRFLALAGVAAGAALAGCPGDEDPPEAPAPGDWMDGVPHYEGFEDHTGEDEVTVLVGAGDDGFLFDPPAVTVDPGTTVVWEWTGEGGDHVVSEEDEEWGNPEGLVNDAGHVWEREFTEAGTHRYECWPHSGQGMRGAIFVDATDE
jgi:halocyanin-like protein